MNQTIFTISQAVETVNLALQPLAGLQVLGEVSGYKVWQSKWVFFDLKDEASTISCFMPLFSLRGALEDGMLVRAQVAPKLRDNGRFSFTVSAVVPEGAGALKRAYELLLKRLQEEGLFAAERKRALPRFPEHVALITSREAAAYTDFLKVLKARQGGLTVSFLHTQVQGETAPAQIVRALEYANTFVPDLDAIILVRGGGSLEDLQAFNDEAVVRAVAASRTPTIVGIGHERDVTLAELAADVRASTPSNAAELLVRSRGELTGEIAALTGSLKAALEAELARRRQAAEHAMAVLKSRVVESGHKISERLNALLTHGQRLKEDLFRRGERLSWSRGILYQTTRLSVQTVGNKLEQRERLLKTLSPAATLARGYSITRNANGALLKAAAQARRGEKIETQLQDGKVKSIVA